MIVSALLTNLAAHGYRLTADGERLVVDGPQPLTDANRAALALHKPHLLAWLRAAALPWPPACLAAAQRFGQPHARLFPLIGQGVMTPDGPGVLEQVFHDRAAVIPDVDAAHLATLRPDDTPRLTFLPPDMVAPILADWHSAITPEEC
jgi:hypothetical protein